MNAVTSARASGGNTRRNVAPSHIFRAPTISTASITSSMIGVIAAMTTSAPGPVTWKVSTVPS